MSVDYEKQRRRVLRLFEKWRACLGLGWWTVDLAWEYDRGDFKDEESGYECVAFVTAKWEYRTATVHLNMHLVPHRSDEEVEGDLLHELVHIPLFELEADQADFLQHRERVVCSLTRAFQWVREAGYKEGRLAGRREMRKELAS